MTSKAKAAVAAEEALNRAALEDARTLLGGYTRQTAPAMRLTAEQLLVEAGHSLLRARNAVKTVLNELP